jgi:hypothetical protein
MLQVPDKKRTGRPSDRCWILINDSYRRVKHVGPLEIVEGNDSYVLGNGQLHASECLKGATQKHCV